MSADLFDLGLRLRAAATAQVAPRLCHATIPTAPHTIAVQATPTGLTLSTGPGHLAHAHNDRAALDLLGTHGITITATSPTQIITDTHTTHTHLARLAQRAPRTGDHAAVAAHLAWTLDRTDYPDHRAGYVLTDACRTRWVTGTTPTDETDPATWRTWLHLPTALDGLHTAHHHLTDAVPLPMLESLTEAAMWTWITAQNRHTDGHDWRTPDTPARAALALHDRCDATELWAAALMDDPLWRMRAQYTGHVIHGTLLPDPTNTPTRRQRATLICERTDCRLTPDTLLTGWYGPAEANTQRYSIQLTATAYDAGKLLLHLTFPRSAPVTAAPFTLREAAPNRRWISQRRRNFRNLYALRRSWLTTGRTPTLTRRDVPLEVLVAGAEPDPKA